MSQRTTNAARAHARAAGASRAARAAGAPGPSGGGLGGGDFRPSPATGRPGFGSWLRYRFDLTLSRGSGALIGWLAAVTLVFVVLTGLLLEAVVRSSGGGESGLLEGSWQALMRTLDPGTVTGDEGWSYRSASLFITLVGIFIFSTLIGLIASVIDRAIEGLRKGRGVVPESGHTVVLGWSEKLHTIISELQVANANQRRSCIVVLAPRDRVWMEDEINARFGDSALGALVDAGSLGSVRRWLGLGAGRTRIVCRTGNPADPSDLALISPRAARSLVVLSDDAASSPDAEVTKVLLALMSFDRDLADLHVLAEFTDAENAEAMHDATAGGVHTIVSGDLIARITAQICRQSGLGAVYQELLDFDGDELYFHDDASLDGARWGQVLLAYPDSSPIGIRHGDGRIELNPAAATQLTVGDQVIAISEDDDTLHLRALEPWVERAKAPTSDPAAPDHLLMVGWNDLAPRMLEHLAGSVSPGSTVNVVIDPQLALVEEAELPRADNLEVRLSHADTSRLEPLREVLGERDYERIVLVGYRSLPPAEADARTLLGLVHARRILDGGGHRNAGTSIVAELLEPRSVQLGRIANPDDFVVSERLASLLLAQVSENGELAAVFHELLDGTGVEIRMHPAELYAETGDLRATWEELVRAAALRDESAIGYMAPRDEHGAGGVVVNPAKSAQVPSGPGLQVIVVS